MKNPENRDIMTRLYRLIEKYETPPKIEYAEDAAEYFTEALLDCTSVYDSHKDNEFATDLAVALYGALEKRFKRMNPDPLKNKPGTPEPIGMF